MTRELAIGDRIIIVGVVPWSGQTGRIVDVGPEIVSRVFGEQSYKVLLDTPPGNQQSFQGRSNLRKIGLKR